MEQDETCSKYKKVKALLLYWELRDEKLQNVDEEVYELQHCFTNDFCFDTEIWKLPCNGRVTQELTNKLNEFGDGAHEGELLILYYGGHAGNHDGSCTWYAGVDDHSVEWTAMAQILTNNQADVLFILDCCKATSSVAAFSGGQARHGANWLLASSGTDKRAAGVIRTDFTQLMIRTLKDMAHDFYANDLDRITSEDVHTALHLDHYNRLVTNAVHVRLNRRHCGKIHLTPLIKRRQRGHTEDGFKYQLEYPSSQSSTVPREVSLDVVLVPGGDGNPVTSFKGGPKDRKCLWPQEVLCPSLEAGRVRCRMLPFQHHWTSQGYTELEKQNFIYSSETLAGAIYKVWRSNPLRPLLFVAYGRGCTVLRRALDLLHRRRDFYDSMPKIGCILCGTNPEWERIYLERDRSKNVAKWEVLSDVILWIDRRSQTTSRSSKERKSSTHRRSSSSRERTSGHSRRSDNPYDDRRTSPWDSRPRSRSHSHHRSRSRHRSRSHQRSRSRHRSRSRSKYSEVSEARRPSRERSRGKERNGSQGRGRSTDRQSGRRSQTPPSFEASLAHGYRPPHSLELPNFGGSSRPPSFTDRPRRLPFDQEPRVGPSAETSFGYHLGVGHPTEPHTMPTTRYGHDSSAPKPSSAYSDRGRKNAVPTNRGGNFFVDLNWELAEDKSSKRLDLILMAIETLLDGRRAWKEQNTGEGADYSWRFYTAL